MEIERARFLVSEAGQAALDAVPPGSAALPPLRLADFLRRQHSAEHASAIAEQVALGARAGARFGSPGVLRCWTAEGLEMMTHPVIAERRARRLAAAGMPVADLTCGIGGDLMALANTGARAIGVERDHATSLVARANVPAAGVVRGDARTPPLATRGIAVFVDPSRRSGTSRTWDPNAFSPPWAIAIGLAESACLGCIKAQPGLDHAAIPAGAETEFVQLGRSMREAALWFGAGATPGLRRALLLPAGATLTSMDPEADAVTGPIAAVIYDPESCVTRAGLVRHLGHRLGAHLLDAQVAYLSGTEAVLDPLVAAFEVLDVLPFSLSRIRVRLRERGWRPEEIRRRAFPIEPDELRQLIGPITGDPVTLLCTTIAGKRTAIVARRLVPVGPA